MLKLELVYLISLKSHFKAFHGVAMYQRVGTLQSLLFTSMRALRKSGYTMAANWLGKWSASRTSRRL